MIDLLTYITHGPPQKLLTQIHYFILGHSRDEEHFSLEHSDPIGSFTLGHIRLLEGDQIDSLHGSIATLLDLLHWGTSIFWREIRLILYIGAFDE